MEIASKEHVAVTKNEKEKVSDISNAEASERQFKKGIEEFKKGNFRESVECLKIATRLQPSNAKYWNYLSLSLTKTPGGLEEAEKALLEAIKIDPGNADYYVNLGLVHLKSGNKKKARDQFEKALKLNPNNIKAKKGLEKAKI